MRATGFGWRKNAATIVEDLEREWFLGRRSGGSVFMGCGLVVRPAMGCNGVGRTGCGQVAAVFGDLRYWLVGAGASVVELRDW